MRLPLDPRDEARRLAEAARERLPAPFGRREPVGEGLDAFDDVPCARIPVWRPRGEAPPDPPAG